MAFFSKPMLHMITFLQQLAVIREKSQHFRQIYLRKYILNHNIDPKPRPRGPYVQTVTTRKFCCCFFP
jgi:hypothetical protein